MNSLDLFSLSGRTAVVTGGAGLLGREICGALYDAGANVVVADISERRAEEFVSGMAKKKKQKILAIKVDVIELRSVRGLFEKTIQLFGRVDIVVNAAANNPQPVAGEGCYSYDVDDFPLQRWNEDISANLTGTFLCCREAIRHMKKRGGGSIINISSIYGLVAPEQRLYDGNEKRHRFVKPITYCVTKTGVLGLTRYFAAYCAPFRIRVNAISFGGVFNKQDPSFVRRYEDRVPLGRMARPDEIRGVIIFLASDASSYATGTNVIVDGGWTVW